MPIITRDLAKSIAKKLRARIEPGRKAHDIALFFHEGKLIVQFGIRRGSSKDAGHDHVPEQLHLRPHQAKLLGQCPMSLEDYINVLADKGLL